MLSITGKTTLLKVVTPEADSVVNAPVLGLVAPMVELSIVEVVIVAPVKVGLAKSALVATAVAIFANSTLISVPLTTFKGLPDASASLVAKFVVCV
jgi:hypothetical protein